MEGVGDYIDMRQVITSLCLSDARIVDFFPKSKSGGGERHETTGNTPQELLRQE